MNRLLFKYIDNTGLILFRIVFGALIAIEAFGAILTGWLKQTLIEPAFTFNFIGFDFLQPLPGNWMYVYFILMGIFGLGVLFGYKYKFSMFCYALMWSCVYLMQKSSYNNHYYLMMLLCWIMVFLPAHRWFSLDAKINPEIKTNAMPRWCLLFIIAQVWVVYTYASVAKLYPGWLNASVPALLMEARSHYWGIGDFLQNNWVHWCIAYVGIAFDLLIIPLMLWKRTRVLGFAISVFFHLFNSIVFQIGIFPYMSIAFALLFFSPQTLIRRFLPKKPLYVEDEVIIPNYKKPMLIILSAYLVVQIALPLRHWFYKDDVLWTEEGHRLSWRMMLRSKHGSLTVWVEDKKTGLKTNYNYSKLVSKKQRRALRSKPDMLWQLAQRIKKTEAKNGNDVAVYMNAQVSVNNGPMHQFTDASVDLASEPWYHFKHHEWILPAPKDYSKKGN